jgi:hypothetical protein
MNENKVKRLNAKVPPMMGATEVAAVLGVKRANLRKVANLPEPAVTDLARGDLWREDIVLEFAAERRERFGLEEGERRNNADPVPA